MKFYTSDLSDKCPKIDKLSVLPFENSIYLVSLEISSEEGLLYEGDTPKRFKSAQQIREYFEDNIVEVAQMLQQSPYDEMIGNPPSAQHLGSLPFSMASTD